METVITWGGKCPSYEELIAGSMQITEYFATGEVSTKFVELANSMLKLREFEELLKANKVFYITGTPTIH